MEAMAAILKNKMAATMGKLIRIPSSIVLFSSNFSPVERFPVSDLMCLSSVTNGGHYVSI